MFTLLLLLCVLRNAVAFEFRSEPRGLQASCTTNQGEAGTCVHVLACDEFRSGEQLLHHRPKICYFDGKLPVICCKKRAAVSEPLLQSGVRQSFIPGLLPRFRRETALLESEEQRRVHIQVVDGFTATRGSWPWMVALGRPGKQQQQLEWFCGGTLIGRRHVLTAAHCLPTPQSQAGLTARLGATDLQLLADPAVQDRQVSRVLLHPRFNAAHDDLALLTLSRPAELTVSVQPVCLPPAGVRHDGRTVLLAGWGLTEFAGTDTPDALQEAPLEVSDVDRCEGVYSETIQFHSKFPGGFQDTKLCAEDPRPDGHRDACRGDSGGPLVLQEDGLYQLVGIVSAGIGCGNPTFPGVYTRVSAYIDWIQEAMLL